MNTSQHTGDQTTPPNVVAMHLAFVSAGALEKDSIAGQNARETVELANALQRLSRHTGDHIETSDPQVQTDTTHLATFILQAAPELTQLNDLQEFLTTDAKSYKPIVHQAMKCALSRHLVCSIQEPVEVHLIVAMYKEQNRMCSRTEHPNGENFLVNKAQQMGWLFRDTPVTWQITYVDDGCPNKSGKKAKKIIDTQGIENSRVLSLQDAINAGHPITNGLKNAATDSQKGGAVQLGMWEALRNPTERKRLIGFTDSDLSYDLRMLGILLHPIVKSTDTQCAIGSRYLRHGYIDSPSADGMTGPRIQAFVSLRAQLRHVLLPQLDQVADTNAGFKMFDSTFLAPLLRTPMDPKFAFDQELLLRVLMRAPEKLTQVPVFSADSVAEATSRGAHVHLEGLQNLARIYQRNRAELKAGPDADLVAEALLSMDLVHYTKLMNGMDYDRLADKARPFSAGEFVGMIRDAQPVSLAEKMHTLGNFPPFMIV